MTTADAAVIVPHYNDVDRLDRCLAALMLNDIKQVEIVVVDNGSTQPMDTLIAKYDAIRFLNAPEKGAAVARNVGVAETDSPLLFFIDADCVPDVNWIARGFQAAKSADLTGGRVEVFDETPSPRTGTEAFENVFAFNIMHYINVQGFTVTANLITNREVFEQVGKFHNGTSEDKDWCMRAVEKGYSLVYDDGLIVGHPSRQNWPELRHKWHRVTKELFTSNGSNLTSRISWGLRGIAMLASILVHVPKVLMSNRLSGAGERFRGTLTLIKLRLVRAKWMISQAMGYEI